VNRQTRDLLVFRDDTDKAVLSTPLSVWRPEDVDRVTEALGIQPAGRRFVNSASELEMAAHGAPQPPTFALPRRHRWIVVLTIYVLVIVVVVVILYAAVVSRHIPAAQGRCHSTSRIHGSPRQENALAGDPDFHLSPAELRERTRQLNRLHTAYG